MVLVNAIVLTRPDVLIVLLEYIDLFSLNGSIKQTLGKQGPSLPLPFYIAIVYLNSSILAKCILLKCVPAFFSLLSYFSKNYSS